MLCRQLLRLQRGSEGGYFFPDAQDDFIGGDFAGVGFVSAKSHFHAVFLPVSWAGNQTDGDAKQIRIGEHDAGAYVPVIIENLHACTLQLIIQGVSHGMYFGIVTAHTAQMNLPGSDGDGP